ncbi:4-(cytidine 5'-diphospho)-2-C-methyl-D-erythritol kinase [Salinibacterium sp. NSLL150]|uniref:4-(cytidine 5'-diphospho)-2-C-methyl-D-erythritol kinase n=1 Tax=unclassified Salinibacterium TaxID=2632331 RepID=UPI0018CDB55B|nr:MULTISPECIES: 4-(cytidine 5'-diphospho)-2-C-methyl-D-erythritol kinase [unclassified Salinibacterium]MBH0099653.1 4-(cytidine 5'-diphospho)-2-C-methyl-D-erythritol kinase [Salinibacterium sp. NSLL35]MBH0102407.1 4-(cytidine 5'-diphospho)-2-C-methyl-D-erythritol kinase [Salinibacterium sp. NSLL150]MBH0105167.1 4-(cytidine 5'-diphospho)-2-C-methyl-D-erythritol kinase [Salinibacterium sp. NSLL16]MBH0107927.1 4-(cytidine 5'-diphospho)-2-C-methyl-D-erythritol kinase [Salinibacterium sp. NSLL17]M
MTTAPAASTMVHARAPGKVNVFLKVGSLLDDGYHDVAIAYQALSLCEDVRAFHADDFSVSVTGTVNLSRVPTDGSNIAIQAARLLARRTGYRGGVRLEIEKHVPVTGGMGGGSADAAATLLACDALWGTNISREEMLGLASELGSDVPFALTGGTAIGTGRGDRLSPALAKGQFQWVLALADFGLSTPEVYTELDLHRQRHSQDIFPAEVAPTVETDVLQALRAGDPHMLAECLHNDLQAPALKLQPSLAAVIELGEKNGALAGVVSGSGPTVAFLTADLDSALELQIALSAAQMNVVRATGPVHGARIINA